MIPYNGGDRLQQKSYLQVWMAVEVKFEVNECRLGQGNGELLKMCTGSTSTHLQGSMPVVEVEKKED